MARARYAKAVSNKRTPQSQPIPGREKDMKKNSAGGYSFKVDCWTRLNRFLILGAEGGSYYASERKLIVENATSVQECLNKDGVRVVDTVLDVLKEGRAPKVDACLFVLALAAQRGNDKTRAYADQMVPQALNIGTHFFDYFNNIKELGGFPRGRKNSFARLYNGLDPERLAFLLAKYQQRNGVTHRDILRQSHVKPIDEAHNQLYSYAVGKLDKVPKRKPFLILWAMEKAKTAKSAKEIVKLIEDYNLPQECIPTEYRNNKNVADALLQRMPITATIRGLGKMTAAGVLAPMSSNSKLVIERLTNPEILRKGKVHPIHILNAMMTYKEGHGFRGSLSWSPNQSIVDALDEAYYLAFKNIEPTGKRFYLGLDVSGSMTYPNIAGMNLSPRDGAAAMAMVTARTEKQHYIAAFTGSMVQLNISSRQRLDTVINETSRLPFGRTDCSLPMVDALQKKIEADVFIVYTDSETWAGRIQPVQALREYRQKMGIDAKLIVCGMVSNGFSIADPNDAGMLDVVGFDSATPRIISDFSKGLV